jgi:hypothetical protein
MRRNPGFLTECHKKGYWLGMRDCIDLRLLVEERAPMPVDGQCVETAFPPSLGQVS